MGYPMAGHLANNGLDVCVYNRTQARAEQWQAEYGGVWADTPADAVVDAEIVFCCVGNDDDLRCITLGSYGSLAAMAPGSLLVDHTTASAKLARELEVIAAKTGVDFMDAPVSGGQAGAENGVLTIMCGASNRVFDRAKLVMDAYAQTITHMGPVGHGQLTKMVNQICIAGMLQGLAEGVAFAINAGLDAPKMLEAISQGAAGSWQMHNRGQTMVGNQFEFGFAVDWMRKDLAICLAEAELNGSTLPVTAMVDQFYAEVQALGGGRWDTSSLLRRLPCRDLDGQ
jgi:3-hydroxyisobutyrate dehydrogenase-like beta-hydroxyacid dehydrogenase